MARYEDDYDVDDDIPRRRPPVHPGIVAAAIGGTLLLGVVIMVFALARTSQRAKEELAARQTQQAKTSPRPEPTPVKRIEGDRPTVSPQKAPAGEAPRPDSSERWNHQDLAAYLRLKGVTVAETVPTNLGRAHGPALWFSRAPLGDSRHALDDRWQTGVPFPDTVYVQISADAQAAHDEAGTFPNGRGWSWQRFLFAGDAKYIAEIRRALQP